MAEQHRDKDQQNYLIDQARAIRDEIEVSVFGPSGADTPLCAEAWSTAKLIAGLIHRIEALEARNEGDKDAWAARLRRPGRSQAERIASLAERITSLQERIEALEVAHRGRPNHEELPDSSLVHRVARAMNGATEWQARAAIREVADWLSQDSSGHLGSGGHWAIKLEQEAER